MHSNSTQWRSDELEREIAALTPVTRAERALAHEVVAGLRKTPKEISPEWFYDEAGSTLFDMICELPEYYPTRTELSIMQTHGQAMAQSIGPNAALIEFGSGTSMKTRLLLDRMEDPAIYVPIDIACIHLLDAASSIARDYPWLSVSPYCADFRQPIALPARAAATDRRVIFFPGSTIGNFEPDAARELLHSMRALIGANGGVVIGVDLKKDAAIIERAYDDSTGITAAFNLNALRHINRELHGDFRLDAFDHQAVWVDPPGRVEMRLVSERDQEVTIGNDVIAIAKDEYILTERCYKYTLDSFRDLVESAGFVVRKVWCDEGKNFSVHFLEPLARNEARRYA